MYQELSFDQSDLLFAHLYQQNIY
ncbi:unnamed protein product [Acanthoscelides obtectus]|uniref:Uncharacterized protein n=1 Tax=Acanthoscelides obtectus TaxID=200917 RepID=A0A9P0PGY2_ACAOB|nr:unnamed protein product [Acanthoscelides obtectus]CAK1671008.1 hypothetical protein AOBTE_LOCUS27977 [Acanthoscelides obtectus]